ncbi:C-terminal binding protein [Streptomyces tricolor]|uniref:C-terminal binding protein n=1 Tax=Streptomyces tricolor TaxID=68277 RepID=UPI00382FCF9C
MVQLAPDVPKGTGDDHDTAPVVWVVDAPGGGYVESPDIEGRVVGPHGTVRLVIVPDDERDRLPRAACDYMILWHRVPLDASFFARNTRCRAVICASTGYDHVAVEAARAAGTSVFHIPHYGTEEVADHTLALFLAQVRRLPDLRAHVRDGGWDWRSITDAPRVRGMTWGIVGLGRIGLAVAQRARAFGIRVCFYDPHNHPGVEKSLGIERRHSLDALLTDADVVSVHVPLDSTTHHLLGAAELDRMKPGSLLINTARGAVVDVSALRQALAAGRPGRVALDVVEGEPELPHWLRDHPRVLLTPHAAFYSVESLAELRTRAAEAARELIVAAPVTSAVRVA